jgi:hypothetical protein
MAAVDLSPAVDHRRPTKMASDRYTGHANIRYARDVETVECAYFEEAVRRKVVKRAAAGEGGARVHIRVPMHGCTQAFAYRLYSVKPEKAPGLR